MYEHTSLSQDDFYQKGRWVEYPLTSLLLWPPRSLSAGMWSRRSHDSLNEKWMRSWMRNVWSGQGPASSLICAAILILEFQSIGNESLAALLWWVPIFLLTWDCGLFGSLNTVQTLRAGSLQLLIDGVLLQSVSAKIHCLAAVHICSPTWFTLWLGMWWGAAISTSLSPPWLLASQHAHIPIKSRPLRPLCLSQQARMLPKPTWVDPFSFTHAYQRHLDVPSWCFFSSLSYLVTWRSFLQLFCIGDLPISNWFSVRIIPHVDVFLMCFVGEGEFHILLLHHLDPLQEELLSLLSKHIVGCCVRLIHFSNLYIIEKLSFIVCTVVFLYF